MDHALGWTALWCLTLVVFVITLYASLLKMQSLFCDRLVWAERWVTFYHHENVVRCDDDLVELCRRVNSFLEMYNALENVKA
jgi:hypothetical protein